MNLFSLTLQSSSKKSLTFSSGEMAKQANGSVIVSLGDTVVLVTACMSKGVREGQDFLPLTVEYQEKTYAMGKIPGGFIKREGRPKDAEILSARLIDRSVRPLFPKGFVNDVQIMAFVLSSDGKNDPDVLAINGASCALFISDIPYTVPIGAGRVSKIKDEFFINPTYEEREKATIDMVVVGNKEKVIMLEGEFREAKEEEVVKAINYVRPFIQEVVDSQVKFREKVGREKRKVSFSEVKEEIFSFVRSKVGSHLEKIYGLVKKEEREEAIERILENLSKEAEESNLGVESAKVKEVFYQVEREFVREKILNKGRRPDSRGVEDIRPIECKVSVFPRTHGSSLFTRGQTQALAVTTLGTSSDEQLIEALEGEKLKHFMLHYTFPPFSVGDVKPVRGPTRREIGHGALAERSLLSVIPPKEEFPYTMRIVSEILESNGSSSMASVCAASLSLMDAGVPIKEPVAGIALGLVKEGDRYVILTDIAGVEDHYGDMDFKVAGTKEGITAIQLDVKIDGLDEEIIRESLERAKKARLFILEKMNEAISLPRQVVSKYAPKIKSFKIDPDKIGCVIGAGGKVVRKLIRENNVTIDIDDEDGTVSVVAETEEDLERTVQQILTLTKDIEIGEVYQVKITRITNFGAFCEIVPGKVGLIHISEISDKFVKDIHQFLKEGDVVKARVINIDPLGRITLSMKQAR